MTFDDFFRCAFGRQTGDDFKPFEYQRRLAEEKFDGHSWPDLLDVPTGMGKTAAVVLAWLWKRDWRKGGREGRPDADTPRRLVYCLPMRVLVEQTYENAVSWLDRLGILAGRAEWENADDTRRLKRYVAAPERDGVSVHLLMGGSEDVKHATWAEYPEKDMILIGTQDMLLSRALMRGYGMSRYQWPVHFGLLNNDCLWIIDEVQLMGPGLWTTAQLDWMRKKRFGTVFDCPTIWMSATVGTSFLDTQDRKADGLTQVTSLPTELIDNDQNPEATWRRAARKAVTFWQQPKPKKGKKGNDDFYQALAGAVKKHHLRGTLTLVVCNTVEAARRVFESLPSDCAPKVLLTSRFRRQDREAYEKRLLDFEVKRKQVEAERERTGRTGEMGKPLPDDPGLICVSTQVVEAGVDVSAHQLWSEIAPWPSVIQRLGRLNRDGRDQDAQAWFWETPAESLRKEKKKTKKEKDQNETVGPYDLEDINRSKTLLQALVQSNLKRPFVEVLKDMESQHKAKLTQALQPKPEPMPRALDVHALFSTERDVHGGFTDVSAFVRGIDPDADLTVIWRTWEGGAKKSPPLGDELDGPPLDIAAEGCPVPFYRLRETLKTVKARAWLWNEEDERWDEVRPDDLRPGMTVMLHRETGGYSKVLGWTGDAKDKLDDVPRAGPGRTLRDEEWTEIGYWVTLDVHLGDAQREAEQLCEALGIEGDMRKAVVEAAGLHDFGKAHPQWQHALPKSNIGPELWAKCPRVLAVDVENDQARGAAAITVCSLRPGSLPLPQEQRRRNRKDVVRLRWALDKSLTEVELSQLRAVQGVLWAGHVPFRPNMRHEAATALAMWHRYRTGQAGYPALAVYLAAAHHGKVRTVLRSLTRTGNDAFGVGPEPSALTWNGGSWPLDFSVVKDGAEGQWTPQGFMLDGHGWTGLVSDLLGPWRPDDRSSAGVVPDSEPKRLGPFQLAYLEALVRIADWRASDKPSQCTKPSEVRRGE